MSKTDSGGQERNARTVLVNYNSPQVGKINELIAHCTK